MIGQLKAFQWVWLWENSVAFVDGSPVQLAYPDGKPLDEQPALLVEVFGLIEAEWRQRMVEEHTQNGQ